MKVEPWHGRIVSVAVTVSCGRQRPSRRALGVAIGASEAETFWTEFLRSLARRGLRGVQLVISDDHKGLGRGDPYPRATWQRCRVHFVPQPAGPCRPPGPARLSAFVATAFAQEARTAEGPVAPGRRPAQAQGAQAGRSHGRSRARRPRLHELPQGAPPEVALHKPDERLHAEVKRRTNVVGIFPKKPPSHGSSAPSFSSRTTSGPSQGDT